MSDPQIDYLKLTNQLGTSGAANRDFEGMKIKPEPSIMGSSNAFSPNISSAPSSSSSGGSAHYSGNWDSAEGVPSSGSSNTFSVILVCSIIFGGVFLYYRYGTVSSPSPGSVPILSNAGGSTAQSNPETGLKTSMVKATNGLYLRTQPDETAPGIVIMPKGTKVFVHKIVVPWLLVSVRDERGQLLTGYAHGNHLTRPN